jgi:hypothetical protein
MNATIWKEEEMKVQTSLKAGSYRVHGASGDF